MRICIDASPAVHGRAGIGRYVQELAPAILRVAPDQSLAVFYNRAAAARPVPPLDRMPHLAVPWGDKPWRLRVLLAHLAHVSQEALFPGMELFHATDNLLPRLNHMRSVFTLHDLAFARYPETQTTLNRLFLRSMTPRFLRAADRVIAISEATKSEAVRLFGIRAERIRVVPLGVSAAFTPATADAADAVCRKYGLPRTFVLSVGTLEPRKNHVTLLSAYKALRNRNVDVGLVIAGKRGWRCDAFFERVRALGLEGKVTLTGFVPDADLPALYSAGAVFAFPSLHEGFGLPPLEAMACGTPVVAADAASLPEVIGNAGLLVDPRDDVALARAIERALTDVNLRASLRARGLERAALFTWERTARETLQVYEEALGQ